MEKADDLLKSFQPVEEVENIRVVVRVRPLSNKEIESGHNQVVSVNRINGTISVRNAQAGLQEPPKVFAFDTVFDTDSKQMDVYNETARPIIDKVLAGYNGTIFAYGQTGTGKTFTMQGINTEPELRGIIPNSFAHIFGQIAKANEDTKFLVRVSYYEIYNEEIRDLLNKNNVKLEVKERPDIGVYIKDLSNYIVNNADDMDNIMTMGNKNRVVGATAMNVESSRSHAVFSITIETSVKGIDNHEHVKMGRLNLVDLAGSERQSKTASTGQRLKEATKINLSLSTLGNVISALVDGKCSHIPYRNSKLTRILQDSLGGNSKTVMCATIGPASFNYDETISTLRYASRAKNICNRARINENPKDALLRQFQEEIAQLKKQLEESQNGDCPIIGPPSEEEESSDEGLVKGNEGRKDSSEVTTPVSPKESSDQGKEADMIKQQHHQELEKAQKEAKELKEKLENLERTILVGGENLLEKAEEQQHLLELSAKELEQRIARENQLRSKLEQKEAERIDIEEKYSTLQEETAGLSKKMKKLSGQLLEAKSELKDLRQEQQREMEGLLENVRTLNKELALLETIEKLYIPDSHKELIEKHAHWNEDIGEWELKCIAYTGNNMCKNTTTDTANIKQEVPPIDLSGIYLSYNNDRLASAKFHRLRSAVLRRPHTSAY